MASNPPNNQASEREARLSKLLNSYITGNKTPNSPRDGKLLLEAIGAQSDRASCAERLVASKNALDALKKALRFEVSIEFFNTTLKDFLAFLQDPATALLCAGDVLRQLVNIVVSPETVWSALVEAHSSQQLNPEGELGFAWLLLQLVSWVDNPPVNVEHLARDLTQRKYFLTAEDRDLRTLGYRIAYVLDAKKTATAQDNSGPGPGGRHDNDFADFRKVAILPTDDELMSTETAFYRPADAIDQLPFAKRPGAHLDNQFRLLREDFLAQLREDVNSSQGGGKGRRPRTRLTGLSLVGAYYGDGKFRTPFALTLSVRSGLEELTCRKKKNERKAFLKANPKFLKHRSFGCVVDKQRIITFASLYRVEDLMVPEEDDADEEPLVVLRAPDRAMLEKLLVTLKSSTTAEFIAVDTPVFAYEPVLRCLQSTVEVPLWQELFALSDEEVEAAVRESELAPLDLVDDIEADKRQDLQSILSLLKPITLDDSQANSLIAGLRQSVSLIQGPPGTGKSFIGAILAQALIKYTSETMLVVCYTNHALDQFLEDLLDIGIPAEYMVRLGAKSSPLTEHLQLSKQPFNERYPLGLINALKDQADDEEGLSRSLLSSLQNFKIDRRSLMEHLEFSDDESDFFSAFQTPDLDSDEHLVGANGKKVGEFYLYDQWRKGNDAGVFRNAALTRHKDIWKMNKAARVDKIRAWEQELLQDRISGVGSHVESYDRTERNLRDAWDQKTTRILQSKRIIACTTTGAAKYTKQLRSAAPGIVIVEEAGEILESHVLTAMTPNTKQLVLIGDHQQLRPRVNNYALTVEKGEGYDLNRSLFERLIRAGIPHTTLHQQHRMCPEISALVRHLTYPDLVDAPSMLNRDPIKGIQGRVIFIDHKHPELAASQITDRNDQGSPGSKQNAWEAAMVLKIVRYMAQQGYGTAQQVVLTPYLGQLNLLKKELEKGYDPVLNDIDSFELVKAGLMSPATASISKRKIRLSTVDTFQGEESDIVIASLTRSNSSGDIGFMIAPERLNVLLSRARKALVIIGNSGTFLASRRGADTWRPFFKLLTEHNNIHDGLPVKCEQHPDRQNVLTMPSEFEQLCPDGGCSAPCGSKLSCGVHDCPQKCHALTDHSKMACDVKLSDECPRQHKLTWRCSAVRPPTCAKCDAEDLAAEERQKRDAELDEIRQQKQAAYADQLAQIQDEIEQSRRRMREQYEDEDRELALRQRRQDLNNVRLQTERIAKSKDAAKDVPRNTAPASAPTISSPDATAGAPNVQSSSPNNNASSSDPNATPLPTGSAAQRIWDDQKRRGAPPNRQLDDLMPMIGLESVKEAFLEIEAKVELTVRQNTNLAKERFGVSFLGNPGTGKTTVARLYAGFLASVGALPGATFIETTGAKLANEGVKECKKILDDLLAAGGGAVFIDEAYQLTSGNSPGGLAVLDFLLPEVENLTGKVVFILAGYNREMEKFFAHNPGLPSRFPRKIQFADYEDHELLKIFQYGIEQRYKLRMQLEDGIGGLYCRILSRRVGRGRGRHGFGNARAVENALSRVTDRQAKRIEAQRRAGNLPDDFWLTREDLIGPEPSAVLKDKKSWKALQQLIGLSSVKESISALFDSLKYNYQRELDELPIMDFSLNKVFLGSPGTGKTTVAKLYGRILADIGMLSTDEVLFKTPADFISDVIGGTETKTKKILDNALGKVLVIDEAYALSDTRDPFKTAVIDTIVSEVQNVPGDDRCVLLLGYKEQMEDMMQKVNPGLARRFPIDSGFLFEDFTDAEMAVIFDAKLKVQAFIATPKGRSVALEMLGRMRNRPNFGNAGAVNILLNETKMRQQKRFARDRIPRTAILEAEDFDLDYERSERAVTNLEMLFKGVVGCDKIVDQMKGYQNIATNMRERDMDPRAELPFTFLFRGPPGTGKTTTARKMGKVYYDMGFLATAEVVECSVKDMVGSYVGHTGPKTQKLIESALGKVLFIDEAYRLGSGAGGFAKEAADELVDCITKPRFLNKIVIILAGYDHEINAMLEINPGLSSRFSESIDFQGLSGSDCFQLLRTQLEKRTQLDTTQVTRPFGPFRDEVVAKFDELAALGNFANGRDVDTISKDITKSIMQTKKSAGQALVVTKTTVVDKIDQMIAERKWRAQGSVQSNIVSAKPRASPSAPPMQTDLPIRFAPKMNANTKASPADNTPTTAADDPHASGAGSSSDDDDNDDTPSTGRSTRRDAGVSDEVWRQLQEDLRKAEEEEKERKRLEEEAEKLKQWLKKCADAKREAELREIQRKKQELQEKLRREAEERTKLKRSGRCPMGYQWVRQNGGYRCAGGSHWVPDSQMNSL